MRIRVRVTVRCPSVRLSVCPIIRPQQRRAAGLLLSAVHAGHIDRQRRAPSSNGAAARRSAANAGSVMLQVDEAEHRPVIERYVPVVIIRVAVAKQHVVRVGRGVNFLKPNPTHVQNFWTQPNLRKLLPDPTQPNIDTRQLKTT